jgi:hypothetical protein
MKKIRNFFCTIIKNYFFINNLKMSQNNEKGTICGFENGAEENCSLGFEDYKEAYTTRCRWS